METSGKYTVSYTPSNDPVEYLQTSIQMSISSEATLSDMAAFFTDFLRASGYVFDGALNVVPEEEKVPNITSDQDFWFNDGFSLTGNPTWSPDTICFSGSGLPGGMGNDVITFG
jgi:hypothetical protein